MNAKSLSRPRWALQCAKAGKDFHIQKQAPIPHNIKNLIAALLLWGTAAAIVLGLPFLPIWIGLPIGGILLGCCFFGHFILIIHECSHNMFLLGSSQNQTKSLNHHIGRLSAVPFFTAYVQHWEKGHVTHHIKPCEADDPQNPDPLDGKRLLYRLLSIWLIPLGFMPFNPSRQYKGGLWRILKGLLFWLPILFALASYSWISAAAVYIGFATLTSLNLLKIAQEHGSGLADEFDPLLRSRTYFYPLQFLFSPFNIHYHFEHHANFNVPWYLLPSYHKAIQKLVPNELKSFYFHHDYLNQMLGTKELPDSAIHEALS